MGRVRSRRKLQRHVRTNDALQVFYGTLPLSLVVFGISLAKQMLLKNILERLRAVEATLMDVVRRLTVLETRAGIVYPGSE